MFTGKSLQLPNQCNPAPDLVSCGMPSLQDLEEAKKNGVRTIVNLCSPADTPAYEPEHTAELGLTYFNIPVTGPADLTREKAMALAAVVNDCANHPVLIHCMSGNRVGALMALKAFYADGASPDAALLTGLRSGLTMLATEVERHLRQAVRS